MQSSKPIGRKTGLASLIAGLAIGVALTGAGEAAAFKPERLTKPWPKTEVWKGGKEVRFPSRSPFSLEDAGVGGAREPKTSAKGWLYVPPDATARTPAPAVIMLHGAGGVLTNRSPRYGAQLAKMGVAALVIDVFGSRRDRAVGFIDRLLNITEAMFIADAYAGLRYLDRLPQVDGKRVVLIGFSYGGMATMYAAYDQVAKKYAPRGRRFAGHISFYGPCIVRFANSRAAGAPLLMLIGGKDAITDPMRCRQVVDDLKGGGAKVKMVIYKNAYHQWDGNWSGPFRLGRSLAPCKYWVHRDGSVRDLRTMLPVRSPFFRKVTLGLCASSDGYLIGSNDAVRARSNKEVGSFLARVLADNERP